MQNDENQFYVIGTEDEKWASCEPSGIFFEKGFNELERAGKFRDEVPAGAVGARTRSVRTGANLLEIARANYHRGFSQAVLIDNYDFTNVNGCEYPRFSVGGHFYGERVISEMAPQLKCGECGKGFFNRCDKSECFGKGDCSFKGRGFFGIFKGCAAGAVIAETTYLTAGSAGLHEGGGWGTVFASQPAAGSIAVDVSQPVGAVGTGIQGSGVSAASTVGQASPFVSGGGTGIPVSVAPAGGSTFGTGVGAATVTNTVSTTATAATTSTTTTIIVKEGGASMAQKVALYVGTAATADQLVMAHFNSPRNIRDAPSLDSSVVGEVNPGQRAQLTGRIRQEGNNIFGETSNGNWILLNSLDGTNPATLSRTQNQQTTSVSPGDVKKG